MGREFTWADSDDLSHMGTLLSLKDLFYSSCFLGLGLFCVYFFLFGGFWWVFLLFVCLLVLFVSLLFVVWGFLFCVFGFLVVVGWGFIFGGFV